jgi:hypothetical protein
MKAALLAQLARRTQPRSGPRSRRGTACGVNDLVAIDRGDLAILDENVALDLNVSPMRVTDEVL